MLEVQGNDRTATASPGCQGGIDLRVGEVVWLDVLEGGNRPTEGAGLNDPDGREEVVNVLAALAEAGVEAVNAMRRYGHDEPPAAGRAPAGASGRWPHSRPG